MWGIQQAADFLTVSRPVLVTMLEDGRIPFVQRSGQRYVRLADLTAFAERTRAERQAILDEMARDAEEDGSAHDDIGFMHPR